MPRHTLLSLAAGLSALLGATAAGAQQAPIGVWIDHTGRGAVEITDCGGGALCGHVVWVKDGKNGSACRTQIIGGAKPVGGNTWDRGWIVDPDDNSRYSVELKPMGGDRLRVVGYMGSKLFSETFTWKRAPADLKRCDGRATPEATTAALPAPTAPAPQTAPSTPLPSDNMPGETTSPAAPAAPPRTASAPEVSPPATAPTAPPAVVLPPAAEPAPPRRTAQNTPEAVTPPAAESDEPAPRRGAKRKSSGRDCKLELPYVTVMIPCDAF